MRSSDYEQIGLNTDWGAVGLSGLAQLPRQTDRNSDKRGPAGTLRPLLLPINHVAATAKHTTPQIWKLSSTSPYNPKPHLLRRSARRPASSSRCRPATPPLPSATGHGVADAVQGLAYPATLAPPPPPLINSRRLLPPAPASPPLSQCRRQGACSAAPTC